MTKTAPIFGHYYTAVIKLMELERLDPQLLPLIMLRIFLANGWSKPSKVDVGINQVIICRPLNL